MKNRYAILILLLLSFSVSAQVGINTDIPQATLHVQKRAELTFADGIIPPRISGDSLRLKEAAYGPAQNGAVVFVTSPTTVTGVKTAGVTTRGIFTYDANATNSGGGTGLWAKIAESDPTAATGTYAAKFRGNVSLLSATLSLFSSNFNYLPLNSASTTVVTEIPSTQITNNQYVVPSAGLYNINFSFRMGQGLTAQLLSNNPPSIAIVRTRSGVNTLLDSRVFGGISLLGGTLSLTLTQGQISHIYNLQAGDILRFGLVQGGLDLSLIADRSAELSVYKIR